MTQANLLKNAVLRNKVETDVSNPAGDISKEIAEQELNNKVGGIVPLTTIIIGPPLPPPPLTTISILCSPITAGVACRL